MSSLLVTLPVGLLLLAGAAMQAQTVTEPPVVLDPFAVTAHPSGSDERTASVWVVAQERAGPAATRPADLLLLAPGLHLDQPGGPGGRATLYLRGADENHTLVYLDDVPLNDPTNSRGGAVDLATIDPLLVGAAAVVRGPASVRHGPEALAGLLHLESSADAEPAGRLACETGGDGLGRGVLSLQGRWGGRAALGFSALASQDGRVEEGSRAQRRFFRTRFALDLPVSVTLTAWHGTTQADSFPDDSGGWRLASRRTLEHREEAQTVGALRLARAGAESAWVLSADAAEFSTEIDSPGVAAGPRDPAGLPATRSETRLRRVRINSRVDRTLERWTLSGGADLQRESGRDESSLDFGGFTLPSSFHADRTRAGLFAEGAGEVFQALTVNAGARLDRYDDGFSRGTVRAGLLGRLDAATQWRVNGGSAFKPASFYALANPLVGNRELRPERARTLEAGLRRVFGDGRALLDLAVFSARFRDGIDFDPGPPPRLVNRPGIRSRGVEVGLRWKPRAEFTLGGAATYCDARSLPDGARLRSRPRWRGSVSGSWELSRTVTVRAVVAAVGEVPDTSIPTGPVLLQDWARVDLVVAWRPRPGLELSLAADNVFDAVYEQAVGFTAPGCRLRAGLRAGF